MLSAGGCVFVRDALFVVCCLMWIVWCFLSYVCCVRIDCCLLIDVRCALSVGCYLLRDCCVLFVVGGSLRVVRCAMFVVCCV